MSIDSLERGDSLLSELGILERAVAGEEAGNAASRAGVNSGAAAQSRYPEHQRVFRNMETAPLLSVAVATRADGEGGVEVADTGGNRCMVKLSPSTLGGQDADQKAL